MAAEYDFNAGANFYAGAGSNDFAPLYVSSNRHGKITQSKNVVLDLWAADSLDLNKRFDFSWGVEALGGWSNKVTYHKFSDKTMGWVDNPQAPPAVWLQQLYAEVKWRCLYLSVGLKDRNSSFVDQWLSSGDLIWSGNTRNIAEARIGFVDFQSIPWLHEWVQADICLSYGKFADKNWVNDHYNYKDGFINPGTLWTYKRLYLRSNPEKPFMFQLGFQMTGFFGSKSFFYHNGELQKVQYHAHRVKDYFQMLLPLENGEEGYIGGDHKGSWDIAARYRFAGGQTLRAYTQWFWEDGTSLLKKNGWDGLWGLEFKSNKRWWIDGAVVEYLDLTNQSGPLHWDPAQTDTPGKLTEQVRGNDNYYNNHFYRSYVNYGMTIGTPMMMGVIYNLNGDPTFLYNKVRAIHFAVQGSVGDNLDWTIKYGHRKAWGRTNTIYLIHPVQSNNWLLAACYRFSWVPGLSAALEIGFDSGNMPMKAAGALLCVSYDRLFKIGKKK